MTVYDRWHKSRPRPGDAKCAEHNRVPSSDHGKGERWQVRWRDDHGEQRKKNFDKRAAADAFDAKVKNELAVGTYVDPSAGKVLFRQRADEWLRSAPFDEAVHDQVAMRLRNHIYPVLGDREMRVLANRPSMVQAWLRGLQGELAPSYIRVLLAHVSAVFSAAVDDGLVARNPCKASVVRAPKVSRDKVKPWTYEMVEGMRAALGQRYAAMVDIGAGLGLRQGEIFGLTVDDVDFLRRVVHVRRQVKIIRSRQVFAPPKGGKTRDVPLPDSVALRLSAHLAVFPAVDVTLPWLALAGKPVTHRLLFSTPNGNAIHCTYFNQGQWRLALVRAGIVPAPPQGQMPESHREHGMHALRHFYASVLLDGGESIKALSEYLGHHDPGFTLRTYTHLMPSSEDRTRKAVDQVFGTHSPEPCALDVPSQEA
ncbi:site-specific integrase [Nonomuraea sp. NPDC005501]|uniref:tyrosine-type recombinase/integrase n=1 Tax=Nonomuraea sp. NPDC005501 TaxID=3156884 RepID=UPI0033B25E26